jgi:hypothetical protein
MECELRDFTTACGMPPLVSAKYKQGGQIHCRVARLKRRDLFMFTDEKTTTNLFVTSYEPVDTMDRVRSGLAKRSTQFDQVISPKWAIALPEFHDGVQMSAQYKVAMREFPTGLEFPTGPRLHPKRSTT